MNVAFALAIASIALLAVCLIFLTNRRSSSANISNISPRGESTEETEADPDASSLRAAWDDMVRRIHAPTIRKMSRKKAPKQGLYYTPYGGPRRA